VRAKKMTHTLPGFTVLDPERCVGRTLRLTGYVGCLFLAVKFSTSFQQFSI
jgi:hypothetical protein